MLKQTIRYRHLLFDLDRTLWDFETNSRTTLEILYNEHGLASSTSLDSFVEAYHLHNNRLWAEYGAGNIKKEHLRKMRFYLTLKQLKIKDFDRAAILDMDYVRICPTQTALFPYAHQLLDVLRNNCYQLYILTNGFPETQQVKLRASGISDYFKQVYDSETIGYAKPSAKIFQYVLDDLQTLPAECLMIGDDWEADIMGAARMGIDQVYFNPHHVVRNGKATHQVSSLFEIEGLLGGNK